MSAPTMDPTFYRSAADAAAAPAEELAYVVAFDRQRAASRRDVRGRRRTRTRQTTVRWSAGPTCPASGDELHHFGWNACSSALKHEGHDMSGLARRYLLVPGLRSSNIHVLDTQPDPRNPRVVRTIERHGAVGEGRLLAPAHHALRPGRGLPDLRSAAPEGDDDGPGGIALLDHDDLRRARAPGRPTAARSTSHYDAWWHLNQNVLISSEWGSPSMIEDGRRARSCCSAASTATPSTSGTSPRAATGRRVDLGAAAPDGAGGPALPRSRGDLGLRRRRDLHRGPVRIDLALVPRGRRVEGREGDHRSRPSPPTRTGCRPR